MEEPYVTIDAQPEGIDRIAEPAYPPYRRIRDLIRPGTTVLDVGCGNGKIGDYLQEAGAVVDGIEPSDARVDLAKARLRYVSTEWAGPGFADAGIRDEYDLITFLDVLEHIPDPVPVLEWAADRIAPGGAICALIPNSAHWSFRLKMLRGDWEYTPHGGLFDRTHVRFFNPETAARLCPPGFVETHRSYAGFGRGSNPRLIALRPRLFAVHTYFEWRHAPA